MASRKPFSQYLAEAKAKYGAAPTSAASNSFKIENLPAKKGTPEDFLSTVLDIASRPLYAVTETVQSGLEWADKAQSNKEFDPWAEAGKTLSAPVRGFLSTNKDDKPMTSDLIEQTADVFGKSDPNYVDVKDNANPVAKGVVGFIGDVALDPLTYVPIIGAGSVAAKVGSKLGLAAAKAAKVGEKAASVGVAAGNTAQKTDAAANIAREAKAAEEAGKAPTVVTAPEAQASSDLMESVATPARPAAKPVSTMSVEDRILFEAGKDPYSYKIIELKNKLDRLNKTEYKSATRKTNAVAKLQDEISGLEKEKSQFLKDQRAQFEAEAAPKAPDTSAVPEDVKVQIAANPKKKQVVAALNRLLQKPDVAPSTVATKIAKAVAPKALQSVKEFKKSYLDDLAKGAEDVTLKVNGDDVPLSAAMDSGKMNIVEGYFKQYKYLYNVTGGRVDAASRLIHTDGITPTQFLDYKASMDPTYTVAKLGERYITARDAKLMARDGKVSPEDLSSVMRQVEDGMPDELALMSEKYATQPTIASPKEDLKIDPFSARFRSSLDDKEINSVRKALGPKLSSLLERRTSEAGFEGGVKSLLKLLNGQRSLNNFVEAKDMQAIDRAMMDLLGIDVAGTNLARRQAASTVGTPKGARIAEAIDDGIDGTELMRLAGFSGEEADALAKIITPIVKDLVNVKGYKAERTATGVAIKETKDGKRIGKREREWNSKNAWEATRDLTTQAAKLADTNANEFGKKLFGRERADYVKGRVMRQMAMLEAVLDQMGIPLWLGIGDGNRIQMSATQAISLLNEFDSDLINMVLFNAGTRIPTTNLYDAVAAVVNGVTDSDLVQILLKPEGEGVYNAFLKGGRYSFNKKAVRKETKEIVAFVPGSKLVERMTTALREVQEDLAKVRASNAANYTLRFHQEANDLTNEVITKLVAFMNDPLKVADALKTIDKYVQEIDTLADSEWAMDLSKIAAKIGVKNRLPFGAEVSGKAATRVRRAAENVEKEMPKATPQAKAEATQQAAQAAQKAPADEAARISDEAYQSNSQFGRETAGEAASTKAYGAVTTDVMRRLSPLMTMFSRHHGMENISEVIHDMTVGFKELRGNFTRRLNEINKRHSGLVDGFGVSKISKVYQEIQRGMKSAPEDAAIRADLETVISQLFELPAPFARNSLSDLQNIGGIGPDVFADYLRQVKIDEVIGRDRDAIFDLEKFNDMVKNGEATDMWDAMSKDWTNMEVSDPIDFLGRWQAALIMANTDGSMVHGALAQFRKMPGAVTNKKTPGFVRLDEYGGKLGAFVPSKTFVREDLAEEFQRMSEFISEARVAGGPVGEWLQKTLFPLQDTWKYLITLPRPGHHIRNMVGDASLTFMAEGVRFARQASVDAFKVMSYGRRNYTDMDLLAALRKEGVTRLPATGDAISNGKYGEISIDEFYDELNKRGLLPKFFISEDIEATASGALKQRLDQVALRGGKIEEGLGTISEGRDHYARIQHALQYVYKAQKPGKFDPKFASKEELFEAMAKQVKRYHPDSSMLTPFEAKYLRPIIPFYSWLRGALPAIIVSAAIRPGRALVFPKASYNMAVAMGVDPNSLSDPFPEDQLFPEFITKQATGPVAQLNGNYYTINPGIANIDVSNDFGTDPFKAMLGMISPILRMPLELSSGVKLESGSKIKDVSEYIDSNIPGVNYISNISGYSTTGSIVGLLKGEGADMQRSVESGAKEDSDKFLSFVNWVTGAGIGNISKQNLIDLAEIEKRNREGEQRAGY